MSGVRTVRRSFVGYIALRRLLLYTDSSWRRRKMMSAKTTTSRPGSKRDSKVQSTADLMSAAGVKSSTTTVVDSDDALTGRTTERLQTGSPPANDALDRTNPAAGNNQRRRIIADDPNWTLAAVPDLVELAIRHIVANFASNSTILNKLSAKHRSAVLKRIATDLPVKVTAQLVDDDDYWRRCCQARWPVCDVTRHGGRWKRMFFERNLQAIIESFVPESTPLTELEDALELSSNYVRRLTLNQLLPSVPAEPGGTDDNTGAPDDDPQSSVCHFDFNAVLPRLPYLEDLELTYGVRDCGMNFGWSLFQFTTRDCRLLSQCVAACRTLRTLTLHRSKVDDDKLRVLIAHLLDHPVLSELDMCHNAISDRGARALGKLLSGRSQLTKLCLSNNNIQSAGAHALAHALTHNTTLLRLDLRLNQVADDGAGAVCRALLRNATLLDVVLAGNELTQATASLMAQVISQNNRLTAIDLSCNRLGQEGGRQLQEAIEQNKTITHMDLRLSECGHEVEYCVNQVLNKNRDRQRLPDSHLYNVGRTDDCSKLG